MLSLRLQWALCRRAAGLVRFDAACSDRQARSESEGTLPSPAHDALGSTPIAQKQNGRLGLSSSATEGQGWTRIGWPGSHKRGRSSSYSQASKACSGRGRFQKARVIQSNYGGICLPLMQKGKTKPPTSDGLTAERFLEAFNEKLAGVRSSTASAAPLVFNGPPCEFSCV